MEKTKTICLRSLILSLLWISVVSAYATEINGINYSLNSDKQEAEVISKFTDYSDDIIIPEEIEYKGTLYRVVSIGKNAFSGCRNLTSITIPNSVTSIGSRAFSGCSSLTYITIPNSVTSISDHAFSNCSTLTSITIPNSVTSIGYDAFEECRNLTSITIPNSVTSIGYGAFSGCRSLTSITIPNSVTSIGSRAFWRCRDLEAMIVEAGNSVYDSRNNCNAIIEKETNTLVFGCKGTIIPDNVTSIGDGAFEDCSNLTSIIIPNSVTFIGSGTFSRCSSLTSITIPNSVTSIKGGTFSGCSSLTSIIISSSVTSIEGDTFSGCGSLTSIIIPNSVTSISDYAFRDCSSLTSITIPNSVTSFGEHVFSGCRGLETMIVEAGNSIYDSRNNCNAIIEKETNTLVFGCKGTIIPNNVTSIGDGAFSGSSPTSITIPNSVTRIEDSAFQNCSSLTSLTIPNSVTRIGGYAFNGCSGLTTINIPNSITYISEGTFMGCISLTSPIILNNVTSIGDCAFMNCSSLTSITFSNNLTSIGEYAFGGCSSLATITIPKSLQYIKIYPFFGCTGLTSVTVESSYPFEISGEDFPNRANATLYVPEGSKANYESCLYWRDFKNILTFGSEVIANNLTRDYGEANPELTYTVNGDEISGTPVLTCKATETSPVGTYDILISKGTVSNSHVSFKKGILTIIPKVMSTPTITLSQTSYTYDGTAKKPTVTIKDGQTVIPASEYNISYSNNINVGIATVTITDKEGGNYNVSGSTTFIIYAKTVNNPTITLSQSSYTYDGTAKTTPVVVKDGQTVIPASEYNVSYSNNINVGTATVTITDKEGGNYTVSGSTTFTINAKTVSNPTIILSEDSYTYDGTAKEPTVTVKDGETIIPADEFSVSYSDNTNAGTATVTITDKEAGNYTVSGSTTFTINTKTVTDPTVTLSETSYTYDGTAKEPIVTVKDGDTIIPVDEYTVSYINNTNAGTATITITDKEGGNYNVSGNISFTINAKIVSDPTVILSEDSYTYDGSAKEPTVTVKDGEIVIPADEYTVSYVDNTNAGTATVTITDKEGGNYIVIGSTTFTINVKTVSDPTVTFNESSCIYDGTAKEPTLTVKDGETIIPAEEYTISYSDNTNAGTATVTITDKEEGNYIVSGSTTFTIAPKTVSAPTISLSPSSYTYDGNAKEPTVIVKDGETIVPAEEYKVSYSNNTNAGTATVTITDKEGGNYSVSGSTTFIINSKTVSVPTISLSQNIYFFDGEVKIPTVRVNDGETVIPASEYTISYYNNTNAGTATVIIIDNEGGNYFVGGSTSFTIYAKTVNNPTIILSTTSYICDGTAKEPTVTVMDDETVIPASEYTISYSNNTNVGTATVTITDKEGGNYIVSGSTTFTIHGMELPADELFSGSNLWAGYVAQEDLRPGTGLKVYAITKLGTTTATASQIDYMPQGVPVLLKRADTTVSSYEVTSGTGTAPTTNLLRVFNADRNVSNREGFILFNDEFVLVNEGVLPAGRVFLPANNLQLSRGMTRSIVIDDDDATGIEGNWSAADDADEQWFDLQGRRLEQKPTKKGIYILNGRKVVVK